MIVDILCENIPKVPFEGMEDDPADEVKDLLTPIPESVLDPLEQSCRTS